MHTRKVEKVLNYMFINLCLLPFSAAQKGGGELQTVTGDEEEGEGGLRGTTRTGEKHFCCFPTVSI